MISPPRLTPTHVRLLTDKDMIKRRTEAAQENEPERFKGTPYDSPDPAICLGNLQQYITDALKARESFPFKNLNKRFMTSLGDDCHDLLKYLNFERPNEDVWTLPAVYPSIDEPNSLGDPKRMLLEDANFELQCLIAARPRHEINRAKLNAQLLPPPPSLKLIEECLGCLDYERSTRRVTVDLTQPEHPYYASLGALANFSDRLLIFAYERQRHCNPIDAPYYFDCLKDISKNRTSTELQTKVAMMESIGEITQSEVDAAFDYFLIDLSRGVVSDEQIIGTFNSRLSDSPRQEADMRRHLAVIGKVRMSDRIRFVAMNTVTTYAQALSWLGAERSASDDVIITLYTIKLDDKPSEVQIARKAVALIAEHRNSAALRGFLLNGETSFTIADAYERLGIGYGTADEENVIAAFKVQVQDSPTQLDNLRNALRTVGNSLNSKLIINFLDTGKISSSKIATAEWPVGLENIGNTCYLNSLLQFYFTVKPVRDLILDFDQHKMALTQINVERKQVGSRKVSLKEIERAQKFVYELQKLFRNLITTNKSSITPDHELARLTLISSTNEEHYRRMSLTSPPWRGSLGEMNFSPVYGPAGPPRLGLTQPESTEPDLALPDLMMIDPDEYLENTEQAVPQDNESDSTLVDENLPFTDNNNPFLNQPDGGVAFNEDKENCPPENRKFSKRGAADLLSILSQARLNAQNSTVRQSVEAELMDTEISDGAPPSPPSSPPDRPPPIPPRPIITKKKVQEELELGAQQDVTEVIANVLFQIECAIKPLAIDPTGEQVDLIKELFYGKTNAYINKDGTIRQKQEFFSDIKVDVASGPRDIYNALDGYFDMQKVDVEGTLSPQWHSITRLPPILQIQVQRVQFDSDTKTSYKSESHLNLREILYMDRYMDSAHDSPLMQKRIDTWKWKEELQACEDKMSELMNKDIGLLAPDLLYRGKDWMLDIQIEEIDNLGVGHINTADALEIAAIKLNEDLERYDGRMSDLKLNLDNQFIDLRRHGYRLHSVFIHRGSVSFGHYWIFIYDFQKNIWRKYNDGYVTEIRDLAEVFEQADTNPATPYFLVYVDDSKKHILVDPVCRNIEPGTPPNPSTEVTDQGKSWIAEPEDAPMANEGLSFPNLSNEAWGELSENHDPNIVW
ncbi:MAG: ubiquitin-specific protease ubp2 [Trizodia sp. TS-e1964]|nr:MAG: ubiquitin-specific protease ubp2 [Trizodia sp. TS-e1964]